VCGGDWGPLAVAGAITTVSDDELRACTVVFNVGALKVF
jgi:hypothetical protein